MVKVRASAPAINLAAANFEPVAGKSGKVAEIYLAILIDILGRQGPDSRWMAFVGRRPHGGIFRQVIQDWVDMAKLDIRANRRRAALEIDPCQEIATRECIVSDARDAIADHDLGQVEAVVECIVPDAGDTVADCDACQVRAVSERAATDASEAAGDTNACQTIAESERIGSDAGDAVRDRNARHT